MTTSKLTYKRLCAIAARHAAALERLLAPERKLFARLCRIAGKLGVPVVTLRSWPPSWRGAAGVFVSRRSGVSRELFRGRHTKPPVIFLRSNDPFTLAHEISHAAYNLVVHRPTGNRDHFPISPLLDRAAARHGINVYCRSSHTELQAEICGRRLLGEKLCPTLRRFSERTWRQLEHAL